MLLFYLPFYAQDTLSTVNNAVSVEERIDFSKLEIGLYCVVEIDNKSIVTGTVIDIDNEKIVVDNSNLGKVTVIKEHITEITVYGKDGRQISSFWPRNPHESRHLFAPTARNMYKGEGYFQSIYLVIVSANYGVTDYFTIGGGASIIPGIDINEQVYFLNPKFGLQVAPDFNIGGGVLYLNYPDPKDNCEPTYVEFEQDGKTYVYVEEECGTEMSRKGAGMAFGLATYGNSNNNVTLGAGYGYFNDEYFKKPVFMAGGMYRIARKTALVSENWFVTTWFEESIYDPKPAGYYTTSLISYGLRFFGERMSVDLAFFQMVGNPDFDEFFFPGIPYLDFVVKF